MITKKLIQAEIEKVAGEQLPLLYRIIRALEEPAIGASAARSPSTKGSSWHDFIAETYGCMADAELERSDEGAFEVREDFV